MQLLYHDRHDEYDDDDDDDDGDGEMIMMTMMMVMIDVGCMMDDLWCLMCDNDAKEKPAQFTCPFRHFFTTLVEVSKLSF